MKMKSIVMLVLLFLATSCSAEEPTLRRDAWGDVIPENITYEWVLQQYLMNGYKIDSLASDRPDSFASPQEAWEMLKKEIADRDSLWVANRMSRAQKRIPISYMNRGGIGYCSFQYDIIEVYFTYLGGNKIDDVFIGLDDISIGDVAYSPNFSLRENGEHLELRVIVVGRKMVTVGGVTTYTHYKNFEYRFTLDLGLSLIHI